MADPVSLSIQDKRRPRVSSSELGKKGEHLAASFLIGLGFRLVVSNFTVPIGRNIRSAQVTGEIDLIAIEGDTIVFIEVKTRSSADFADPLASVTLRKQRQIVRTAKIYRRMFDVEKMPYRFDVVTVILSDPENPKIDHIRGFWSESKFRKKTWFYE